MFRFTIRDVLWLTVVAALVTGWGLDHSYSDNRRQAILAHATRLRDALATARRAFAVAQDNFDRLPLEQGSFPYVIPTEPDWSLADQQIPD